MLRMKESSKIVPLEYAEVRLKSQPASRSIRAFVRKQLSYWVTQRFGANPKVTAYRVDFERTGPASVYSCLVEVRTPSGTWQGFHTAPGLHQALLRSLRGMSPKFAYSSP